MKSIYSIEVLQRILDRWSIGKIEDVTYFENVGKSIWRHHLETDHGVYELYSYPADSEEYCRKKLDEYLIDRYGVINPLRVHSFDRYHVLRQLTQKHLISVKQLSTDLDVLIGATIEKAFRVYGSILQIHLNDSDVNKASVLSSYAHWRLEDDEMKTVVVDTHVHNGDQLDEAIEILKQANPAIKKYSLNGSVFRLTFTNGKSLYFESTVTFPAIEVHISQRKNTIAIWNEQKIYYSKTKNQ